MGQETMLAARDNKEALHTEFTAHAEQLLELLPTPESFDVIVYLLTIKFLNEAQSRAFSATSIDAIGIAFFDACERAENDSVDAKDAVLQVGKVASRALSAENTLPIPTWLSYQRLLQRTSQSECPFSVINRHKKEFIDWSFSVEAVIAVVYRRPSDGDCWSQVFDNSPVINKIPSYLNDNLRKILKYIDEMNVLKFEFIEYLECLHEKFKSTQTPTPEKTTEPESADDNIGIDLCRIIANVAIHRYDAKIRAIRTDEEAREFLRNFPFHDPRCGRGPVLAESVAVLEERVLAHLRTLPKA